MRRTRTWIVAASFVALGCHSGGASSPPPSAGSSACAESEVTQADGTCQPAGVPAAACTDGFTPDGQGGCDVVMPTADCPDGTMAVPGDTACRAVGVVEPPTCPPGQLALPGESLCHELGDCGSAPWGSAPIDATTQFVDGASTGASDGSAARPWKTIGAAIAAADAASTPTSSIAIAAGSYAENVTLSVKPTKLFGRCPRLVEIVGSGGAPAIRITGSAARGSEVHRLAVRGDGVGVSIEADTDATSLDGVWVHDAAGFGVLAQSAVTITSALVEATTDAGIYALSGAAHVGGTLVRGIVRGSDPNVSGEGIVAREAGALDLSGVVVEHALGAGVRSTNSTTTIAGALVRDTAPYATGNAGYGIEQFVSDGQAGTLTVTGSTVARSTTAGIAVGGRTQALIEASRVHDTAAGPAGAGATGSGLTVQSVTGVSSPAPTATVRGSLFERNHAIGVGAIGSSISLAASVVRDTVSDATNANGIGVEAQWDAGNRRPSQVTMTGCLVERNQGVGVVADGAQLSITRSVVRRTQALPGSARFGFGLEAFSKAAARGKLTLQSTLVAGNLATGILIDGADADISESTVRDVEPQQSDHKNGRGIEVQDLDATLAPPEVTLRTTSVRNCNDVGVMITDHAAATIDGLSVVETHALADGSGGDGLVVWDAKTSVADTSISSSARAGILGLGSDVALTNTTVLCASFAVDGEPDSISQAPYSFDFTGGATCGCGDQTGSCQVLSAHLSPPTPLAPMK